MGGELLLLLDSGMSRIGFEEGLCGGVQSLLSFRPRAESTQIDESDSESRTPCEVRAKSPGTDVV